MRSAFHEGKRPADEELSYRLALPATTRLGFPLRSDELFFTMDSEVYELLLTAARLDKKIALLSSSLPPAAMSSYAETLLVDEIVLSNQIEGVRSSRREVGEALEFLRKNDRRRRFSGLVQKYMMLSSGKSIPLATCKDLRSLYDELVADEVVRADKGNALDGNLFRAGAVDVCDAAGKVLHSGIHPETRIVRLLDEAFLVLGDSRIEPLVRAALFHYLLGYIHPFYDGNGRVNRFISSYLVAREYEPIVGFGFSRCVQENLARYYGAYTLCEHALNRGDLTPFVIVFAEIVVEAMEETRASLAEKKESLAACEQRLGLLDACRDEDILRMGRELASATLFSARGSSAGQLGEIFGISRQTVYKRLDPFKEAGILVRGKVGRTTRYMLSSGFLEDAR